MSAAAGERLSEGTGKKVTVIDSWSAYMGEGLMVIDGARAAEKGASHDEVVKAYRGYATEDEDTAAGGHP